MSAGAGFLRLMMEGGKGDGDDLMDNDYVERILMEANAHGRGGDDAMAYLEAAAMAAKPLDPMPVSAPQPEPFVGMEFDSDEAAKNFYNDYARRLGFPFRVGRSRRSKGVLETLIMKRFVCSKEGVYRKKPSGDGVRKRERISMREGCRAFMEVIRDKERWVVSKLEMAHTHVLGTCSRAGYLRARGFTGPAEKPTIVASDASTLLRQTAFGDGGDAQDLLDYFRRRQAQNPGFFYALQVDNRSCVTNAFWADSRSRAAYAVFGDAVSLDTSYKKNKYMPPLVTFSGVNHHLQPVLFGCALLIDETEFSLAWLFHTWLEAMGGPPPRSLTTDQNRAVAAAAARALPATRHRFCKWPILSRTKQKLAHAYAAHPALRAEFEACVLGAETVRAFESSWLDILHRYDLTKNSWLQALFSIRQRWVPLYLRDTFFGELTPAQKLETVNDLYKRHFNAKTSLRVLLAQFDLAMAARHDREAAADLDTARRRPPLKTASPIEKQAAEVYTAAVFAHFQSEFVESLGYTAYKINKDGGSGGKYSVARDEEGSGDSFVVTLELGRRTASCSCGKFEFAGVVCRHILAVLLMVDVRELPEECFLTRWTRNAKVAAAVMGRAAGIAEDSVAARYDDLCREAVRVAEKGAASGELHRLVRAALDRAMAEITAAARRDATININEEVAAGHDEAEPPDPQRKVTNLLGQLLGSTWSPM
ncbi:protein FAR1-RELATED SEQUENCE 9-like [Wolffia australiana]